MQNKLTAQILCTHLINMLDTSAQNPDLTDCTYSNDTGKNLIHTTLQGIRRCDPKNTISSFIVGRSGKGYSIFITADRDINPKDFEV